ncbi:MAG: Crp/Fnr family transcriptional regulator [Cyclobacteriaceae bacterium]|nr:Crp/Fnr family transcriptional regulator [Cyclobacteriaceae bacterium]
MNELKEYLNKIVHFTESEMRLFTSIFSEKHLKKNEYFATEGEYSSKFAFLSIGIVRAFYRNNEGSEYNKTFFSKKGLIGAYSSLVSNQKNQINLQCLTDCSFLIADFSEFKKLFDINPKTERLARLLAEQFFVSKEKREIELVMLDATERFKIYSLFPDRWILNFWVFSNLAYWNSTRNTTFVR